MLLVNNDNVSKLFQVIVAEPFYLYISLIFFRLSNFEVFTSRDEEKVRKESEFWSVMFLAVGVTSFLTNLCQVK